MNNWILSGSLFLFACAGHSFARGQYDEALEYEVRTRLGVLAVGASHDRPYGAVYLEGRKILEHDEDSDSLTLSAPIAIGSSQVVLVYQSSGGIACPGTFVILEIKRPVGVSRAFGNCSDAYRTKVNGNTLEIRLPVYVPHPELLSERELKRRSTSEDVYIWSAGTVKERK